VSMRQISIAVRAENRASSVFRSIASDVLSLGVSFGALDSQTGRTIMQMFSIVKVMSDFKAILAAATATQTAQNMAVGAGASVQTTFAISTTGAVTAQVAQNTVTQSGIVSQTLHSIQLGISSAAHGVYAVACWVATTAANALNISTATFLALTVVGIAAIASAAVAMWAFAGSMNAATSSVKNFNNVSIETPSHVRNIQRAGESAINTSSQRSGDLSLSRQGVEVTP
jgi:hypothetical protein